MRRTDIVLSNLVLLPTMLIVLVQEDGLITRDP